MTSHETPKLVPDTYSETQDLSVHDLALLFSALFEHQDPQEVDEMFAEFAVPDPDVE